MLKTMFKNNFKIAIRNLYKSKGFSAINIIGLACGLATCLLIILYVTNELSYDHYNKKITEIYRADGDLQFGGHHFNLASSPDPLGIALKSEFPQVQQYVRLRDHGGLFVKKGNQNILEDRVILADSTLFDVFTLPMIAGDPHTALVNPNSVVLTQSMATKYFPQTEATNIVGKTITVNDTSVYKISGWIFLIAGVTAVLIALIMVSFQAVKTAIANPIKSWRTESDESGEPSAFKLIS